MLLLGVSSLKKDWVLVSFKNDFLLGSVTKVLPDFYLQKSEFFYPLESCLECILLFLWGLLLVIGDIDLSISIKLFLGDML